LQNGVLGITGSRFEYELVFYMPFRLIFHKTSYINNHAGFFIVKN